MHAWTSKKRLFKRHRYFIPKPMKCSSFSEMIISISSHIRYYTRQKKKKSIQLFSCIVFHLHKRERDLIESNPRNVYLTVYNNEWNWIRAIVLVLFSSNYTIEKKRKEELFTSYDFSSSVKIDWNKTIIEHICISFNMDIFRWEIEE